MPACLPPACPLHFNGPGKHSGPLFISGAESSGLDVIAEGVETLADRDALTALGCTKLQGYFFGGRCRWPSSTSGAARVFLLRRWRKS